MGGGSSTPKPPPPSPPWNKQPPPTPPTPPRPKTPIPPPPSPPLFPREWRKLSWGENQSDLQYVEQYQPKGGNVEHLRVLLYGPVGAGKSSLINSISSTLRGRTTIPAGASATTSDKSHTTKYKAHKIKKRTGGEYYPIVFSDIMGLEDGSGNGVRVEDIKLAMMGHVNDGYTFNPVSALGEGQPGYNPSPAQADRVHVLVCVWSANVLGIQEPVLKQMRKIRVMASDLEIPQIAVITKVDEACGETQKDLKNIYKSKHIKRKMSDLSSALGIPMNCIFPIKNYSEENSTNVEVDTLILDALKAILNSGEDFLDQLKCNHDVTVQSCLCPPRCPRIH